MSKVCMAALNEKDRTFTLGRLQERFPEIPEGVIAKILTQHAYNMEKCLTILSQESDKYLYGETVGSPVNNYPSSTMGPLSIDIPNPAVDHTFNYRPESFLPHLSQSTVGLPSSSGATYVSGAYADRHQSVDDYNQTVLQHQKQRLDRLNREFETEKLKLSNLQYRVRGKDEELMNKKFRVASNPTKTHVDHLTEETAVLRTEIDQMTQVIDNINNGSHPLGIVNRPTTANPDTNPSHRPPPVHPLTKSASFPRQTSGQFYPQYTQPPLECTRPAWLPATSEYPGSNSPIRDSSLEGEGWIFIPKHLLPTTVSTAPVEQPTPPLLTPPREDAEETWQCKHCTLDNHGALNVCEACEMPRDLAH